MALVCFVGIVVGVVLLVFSIIRNSGPYSDGMLAVRSNPQAVAALGEPVEEGWWLAGNISVSGSSGQADITMPVKGPNGSGTVYVIGSKSGGAWTYSTLRLEVDGTGESIDLSLPRAEEITVPDEEVLAEPDVQ